MPTITFPHTFTSGYFAGQTFETQAAYQRALMLTKSVRPTRAYKGRRSLRRVPMEGDHFSVVVIIHGVTYEVHGPILGDQAVDTLLDAIGQVTSALTR